VVMHQGIYGFDHYGIDRALWFGLPWLAKWSRSGMARGASDTVPEGTVGVFDRHEQLAELSLEERERMRAVVLSHDNDPIARFGPDMMVRKPDWIGADGLRGVSPMIEWVPIVTFCQTALDAANAMVTVPGVFESFGHDYRADTARFVRDAFHLPAVTEEQMEQIEDALRLLELERSERIKAVKTEAAPPAPSEREEIKRAVRAGVPLRVEKTRGANWRRSLKGRLNNRSRG
ncbi:MAG TPA: alpha/beta-hydrolase family protein, partial [Acidimicrobiia bacterium]|nr:alpha/beta-hydrolase family protein [Acidimicrobiia bacterium]